MLHPPHLLIIQPLAFSEIPIYSSAMRKFHPHMIFVICAPTDTFSCGANCSTWKKFTPWRMICSVCDKQHNHDRMVFSGNFKYKTQTTDNLPPCPWGYVRFGSFINVRSICAKCCLSHCHSALEESPKWVNFRLEMGEFSVQIWGKPQGSCKP